jgi:hypothetical protein
VSPKCGADGPFFFIPAAPVQLWVIFTYIAIRSSLSVGISWKWKVEVELE